MIRINLLPFRAARKLENIRMQISVYILTVILVCAVLGFSFISLNSEVRDLRKKHTRLKKELASYSEMLKKMDTLTKRRADLKGKLEIIRKLESGRSGPVQLFDEISMAVPKGRLFLKNLSEAKDRVSMAGVAKDYDTVAQFMKNLEKTKTIKTVTLGSTSKTAAGDMIVSNFNLTCEKTPEEKSEVPKDKPKKKGKNKKTGKKKK